MSTREERLERRIADLYATDPQFAAARPSETVTAAIEQPGLGLPQIVRTAMEGYAQRPALGQRAVELVTDPRTGRTSAELRPRFETINYGELWARVRALASAWTNDPVRSGDRVCVLGFTSVDYTTVDLALVEIGAVAVPLQTGAPVTALQSIVAETEPVMILSSIDRLADAVELVLAGPAPTRLVVFDYRPEVDDQRDAFSIAQGKLADAASPVIVETLADVVDRGKSLPAVPGFRSDDDPLALLIYTSGSTGAPKGAMYLQHLVATFWLRSGWGAWDPRTSAPSITLNFMPMSHVLGRGTLYRTLANGGTGYFAAKSDLSTFMEDLALVRPTQLGFVPRIWQMLFGEFQSEMDQLAADGSDRAALDDEVMDELRHNLLGGRCITALTGSAPISPELREWVESFLDLHLVDGYGSTEAGFIFLDGQVQRPPVLEYKLVDVPDLGYFHTDRPYPRGELLVKTQYMFPGYYKRPEITADVFDDDGYYRTGDIMAGSAPIGSSIWTVATSYSSSPKASSSPSRSWRPRLPTVR
jgi:fatty acid CoA ligase FadD9